MKKMSGIREQIKNASEADVRTVLQGLCADDLSVKNKAIEIFHQLKIHRITTPGAKRKASEEVAFCIQCQDIFDLTENTEKSCRLHPGEYTRCYCSL